VRAVHLQAGQKAKGRLHLASFCLVVLASPAAAMAQADDDATGRDFPKTLTLDEPGVDDEVSLPTFIHQINSASGDAPGTVENDINFELDKRLTERLQLQINGGYRSLADAGSDSRYGWSDASLTAKYVVLAAPETETLLTLGATRGFGRTGARGVGAEATGSTIPTFYFGQGLGALPIPAALRAFAVTGTVAYLFPDKPASAGADRFEQTLQLGASLQYSLKYLSPIIASNGLPKIFDHIVTIVELTYDAGANSVQSEPRVVAPGLIYAGDGYQLALEALLPLNAASGHGVGAIAQLNLSFSTLGLGRFARPLW
jgi:hypothetical protein